ncbi:MAG TPA: sugar phosphate isomerase/epimerase family protein [Candidatus Baltobacteraceae bacterium]|jgi:sugar phosphate isomerase/epimerase|nr:sugar phosphate isomerase/epimerase family protein [Candidatus Baltobacteraceae bacterium]
MSVPFKEAPLSERLAVCSWSLQPADADDLAAKLKATGIGRAQLALDPLRDSAAGWEHAENLFRQNEIIIVSAMFGCVGEDYSTLESIRRTGGIAPEATWEQNRKNIRASAALAAQLDQKLVTFHAGFLPHEESDPAFAKMLARLAEVADVFAAKNIDVGLETGQETAPVLAGLLQKLNRPNVGVNFDPANMILYDKGDPVEALRTLAPWIRQVHVKDAVRTRTPGTWGREVAVGEGEVDWPAFFATLKQLGFSGSLVIEREAGARRVADIRAAKMVVEKNCI